MRYALTAAIALTVLAAACGGGDDDGGDTATVTQAPTSSPTAAGTPTPSPTPSASPVPTPTPVLGSRNNPVPIGSPALQANGWEITVLATTPDASALVAAADPANPTPDAGRVYFMADIQARHNGENPTGFDGGFTLRVAGPSGGAFAQFENGCGTIPDPFPADELALGAAAHGNFCWSVPAADAADLIMYYDPIGSQGERTYWDLVP